MGAQGIRRRKPKRRLPPPRVPEENELIPPHIMWPGSASGFEPTNWSPAGRAQLGWRFLQNLTRPGRRLRVPTLVFVWAALALVLWGLFGVLVQILL